MVHRYLPGEEPNLEELAELCETAGYDVVYELAQQRHPHSQYNIGPSKLRELKDAVKRLGIEKVVFENELKPVQEYNLAKALGVEVIDRIRLILEIFTLHASSLEAKLQIKLAEMKYELPRAKEKVRLAKRGEQPGFHGLGAYEADVYYEEISRRIQKIQEKLDVIKRKKALMISRTKLDGVPSIALAGYTNSGKSTLFKRLTGFPAEISDKLFTTLSTKRRLTRILGKPVYVSDTVGFIKNVPAMLVSAFMSTLMEVVESDIVLLMVDGSLPLPEAQSRLNVALSTLRQIGVVNKPIVIVFNKADLVLPEKRDKLLRLAGGVFPAVVISAKTGENMGGLERIVDSLLSGFVTFTARIPLEGVSQTLLKQLRERGRVESIVFRDGFVEVTATTPAQLAERVRALSGNGGSFQLSEA
ncbi:MAG: GTPase HflX [Aigarchaeota archaeon]|nr:GTPase HflX [Candidatus Calditenuaceae archaeon]